MRPLLLLVAATFLALPADRAEACACCDAVTVRKPIGWTSAGGALLVEMSTTLACQPHHVLEIWHVGAKSTAGCYDLLGDPEKRIACEDASSNTTKPRSSTRVAKFPSKARALDASKVRVRQASVRKVTMGTSMRVHVEVADDEGTWKQVWRRELALVHGSTATATIYPNPRGDRGLLLVRYTTPGDNNSHTDPHWVTLR